MIKDKKLMLFFTALATTTVFAAEQKTGLGGLEEITVTAQRREQSLQDVPIAVTAFTAEQLAQRQIFDTYDLVRNIPNLTGNANVGVGTSSSLYIRGLGNGESIATFDLPVGTYVDDVYISRQNHNNFSLFDVDRIEVLRGPQGTLFGRNTTGGAINITMKKPSVKGGGYFEAGAGRFGLVTMRGSVDLPLSDNFLTKFSIYKIQDDGYATQLSTGIKFNDRDATGVRADLRFLPSDVLTIDLVSEYVTDQDTNFLNLLDVNGNRVINNKLQQYTLVGTFVGAKASFEPGNVAKTHANTLNVNWDLSETLSLSSITGYRRTAHNFLVDSGGDLPRVSTTRGFTPLDNAGDHKQVSQEFKLNGSAAGDAVTWVAGVYYMKEDNVTDFANASTSTVTGVFSVTADRTMKNGLKAYAVYAQADYKLTDRLTATAGVRYTDEKKNFAIERNPGAQGVLLSTALISAAGIPLELQQKLVTPRFALQYDISNDVMVFASATRGFKSGGWPARATANNAFIPFLPEKVWSYEIGTRADLFDNRLRLNLTSFHAITDDVQIPARIDVNGLQISTTTNPADLRNSGLELDATWIPIEGLNITAGVGIQDAKYINISQRVLDQAAACKSSPTALYQGVAACAANFVDMFGNIAVPVRSPDYTLSLSASYKLALGNVVLTPNVGLNKSDAYAIGTTGTPQSTNGTWSPTQSYINGGLMLELADAPGFSLTVDCRNCQDKAYPTSALGVFQFLDRPGSWSARMRYRF